MTSFWSAYAAALRAEARDVLEGRNKYPDPPERQAGPDTYQDLPVRELYEESLTGRLTPAIKMRLRR